jgi:hypothetical protein
MIRIEMRGGTNPDVDAIVTLADRLMIPIKKLFED